MPKRPHLAERARLSPSHVIVLIAPAGFGKSYLAREIVAALGTPVVEWDAQTAAPAELTDQLRDAWAATPAGATAVFDSLELIRDCPDAVSMLTEIIRTRGERTLVVSGRPPFPLVNSRVLPPGSYVRFGPEDLRFSAGDVAAVVRNAGETEIDEILAVTGGWPFGVLALAERSTAGGLEKALSAMRDGTLAEVSEFLYREVIGSVPGDLRPMLVAVQAVGASGVATLARSAQRADASNAVHLLSEIVCLLDGDDGKIALNPLLAGVVERRFAEEIEKQRVNLAEELEDEHPVDAARYYLAAGRENPAAKALERALEINDPGSLAEISRIVEKLSSETIQRSPRLWHSIAAERRSSLTSTELYAEVKRLRESLPPETDTQLLRRLDGYLAFFAIDAGHLDGAQIVLSAYVDSIGSIPADGDDAVLLAAQGRLYAARLQTQKAMACYERALPYLENAAFSSAVSLSIAFLRRMQGDREAEIASLNRALAFARRSGYQASVLEAMMHAAFGSWFAGDELEYQRWLVQFEAELQPIETRNLFAGFLEAVRKRSVDPLGGKLNPRWRAFTALIVASEQTEERMIAGTLSWARTEAAAANDPFADFLTTLAYSIAVSDHRDELQGRISSLSVQIPEPAVRDSLESYLAGGNGGPILERFVRRFGSPALAAGQAASGGILRINVLAGTISRGDQSLKLSNRPLALVLTLATLGAISRERLCEALWPDADDVSAANTLKMCVRRTRQQLDDPSAVVFENGLWALRDGIVVDIVEIERNLRAIPSPGPLSPTNRTYLESIFEFLAKRPSPEIFNSEGMETIGLRVSAIRHQIVTRLGENALAGNDLAGVLDYAEVLRRWDATDEASYTLSIRAYAASGNTAEAYREYRQYSAQCERELGIKPELTIEELLKQPAPT